MGCKMVCTGVFGIFKISYQHNPHVTSYRPLIYGLLIGLCFEVLW